MYRQMVAMKAFIRVFVLLSLLSGTPAAHGELVDRIVAIVNDEAITLSELNGSFEPYAKQIRNALYGPQEERRMLSKVRQDILDKMINQKLTDQESKRLGISVHESEVEQSIEQIKREHDFTEEELKRSLAAEGYTLDEYRERIKEQMLRIKLINIEVKSKVAITEEDIRNYYEDHKSAYGGTKQYHLRTILIRMPSWQTTNHRAEVLKRLEEVVDKLKTGAAFDELARQYSEDVSGKAGGDLGWFSIEELSPEFRETLRGMKAGQISPALQTPQGYQVVMLEEIKDSPGKTLKEVRIEIQEKIYREVVEEKYKTWLQALRERSYVKVIE